MTLREWIRYYRTYYRSCRHRSHRLRLKCWRWQTSDSWCSKHNGSCWFSCDPRDRDRLRSGSRGGVEPKAPWDDGSFIEVRDE